MRGAIQRCCMWAAMGIGLAAGTAFAQPTGGAGGGPGGSSGLYSQPASGRSSTSSNTFARRIRAPHRADMPRV